MPSPTRTHSANVELWLHCAGKRYKLGQVGRDILILAQPQPIAGGEAVVETIIDGRSDRYPIGVIPGQSGESTHIKRVDPTETWPA